MRSNLSLVVVAFGLCPGLPALAQIPPGYEVIRLTQAPVFHNTPNLNNRGQVVYSARVDGTSEGGEIFLYDDRSGETIRLTNDNVQDAYPDINCDGTICWTRFIGPPDETGWITGEIMIRSPSGQVTRLTDNDQDDWEPIINRWGALVWTRAVGRGCGGRLMDIFHYDGQQIIRITNDGVSDSVSNQTPRLNDLNQIIWTRYDFCAQPDWESEIRLYDDGVTTILTDEQLNPQIPDLNNSGLAVWYHRPPPAHNYEIQFWQNGQTTVLTDWGGGSRLNDAGMLAFNRWHADARFCCWQRWLYREGTFWQLTSGGLWNVDGDINQAGEAVWISDLDPFTLADAISYMRRFSLGDVNCDGAIDALDIEPFLLALFDPDAYRSAHPSCDALLADFDNNGTVDALDIEPFIDLLFP